MTASKLLAGMEMGRLCAGKAMMCSFSDDVQGVWGKALHIIPHNLLFRPEPRTGHRAAVE
jgi:hypothetical protein